MLSKAVIHTPCRHVLVQQRSVRARARVEEEGRGTNVGDFCSIDASGKKTPEKSLMEKESDFLEVWCPV
jgi:hypothetical protein